MTGPRLIDTRLSNEEATQLINSIARNPASRINPTKHAFKRQKQRLINLSTVVEALEYGVVTNSRSNKAGQKTYYTYAVEYEDAFGHIRVVVKILSERNLLIITVISLN